MLHVCNFNASDFQFASTESLHRKHILNGGSRFSLGGGRKPLSLGQKPIIWQEFENERIWTEKGERTSVTPNLINFSFFRAEGRFLVKLRENLDPLKGTYSLCSFCINLMNHPVSGSSLLIQDLC